MKGSKAMMEGNRWRLFCLQFSFIGWMLLSSLTFGLGNLALRPYQEAAYARSTARYRSGKKIERNKTRPADHPRGVFLL